MITISSVVICLFLYWLFIRGTTRLKGRTRAWIIGGYVFVHAASWVSMHLAARADFGASVMAMHSRGQADVQREIQMIPELGTTPTN